MRDTVDLRIDRIPSWFFEHIDDLVFVDYAELGPRQLFNREITGNELFQALLDCRISLDAFQSLLVPFDQSSPQGEKIAESVAPEEYAVEQPHGEYTKYG